MRDGNKIKVSIRFRGRQITHSEIGLEVMNQFASAIADVGVVERKPLTEGRNMTMIVAPRDAATAAKSARQQPKQEAAPAQ